MRIGNIHNRGYAARTLFSQGIPVFLSFAIIAVFCLNTLQSVSAAGTLTVSIIAAPNLVVDSNVLTPASYGPYVATVIGEFCNDGDQPLQDVHGYIGDYAPGGGNPGIYPSRDSSSAAFIAEHPHLANTGNYSFTHLGGSLGTADANRYIGDLAVGECKVQYWHFEYPRTNPAKTEAVWGISSVPSDDLWLEFEIWGTSSLGVYSYASHRMTMRNEISAMANKIKPNPNGQWFNTSADVVLPGETITTNGINYELGNVNQGFDNDGDFVPDYNAWLQPVGDNRFDPSCFRIIHTEGTLTVSRSGGLPDLVIPFQDQLYFTDLPANNTGVTGEVFYTFAALNGPCSSAVSPYQEVASGRDNEKFNADYGVGIPPVGSYEPKVEIDKSSSPSVVPLGGTLTYQIPVQNIGAAPAGLPLFNMPLTISDQVPAGTVYIAGSAAYTGSGTATILYSTNNGVTWTDSEPSASSVTNIRWRLDNPLPAGETGTAQFQAQVPAAYSGTAYVENIACISIGDGVIIECHPATSLVQGNNSVGDFVWQDEDSNGYFSTGEIGLNNVSVSLYFDKNADGTLDTGDILVESKNTSGGGAYLFANLPDGRYLVEVDGIGGPTGYRLTTAPYYSVALDPGSSNPSPVAYLMADFGFGPTLVLDKYLTSTDPGYEGDLVTYSILLTNNRPGDGSGQPSPCTYGVWATSLDAANSGTGNKAWLNPANAYLPPGPDGVYATAPYNNAEEVLAVNGYSLGSQLGSITKVEILLPVDVVGVLAGDFQVSLLESGSPAPNSPRVYNAAALVDGTLTIDVTGDRTWNWADFNGTLLSLQLNAVKQGNPPGHLDLDAAGFLVTSDQTCGSPDDMIAHLPLSDTYDPVQLEFVSASPQESQVSSGIITWNELGPLYAGQTKVVTVVFRALEPPDNDSDGENDPAMVNNCGISQGATFGDGSLVNHASDCESSNVNPTGTVGDTVWNDNGFGGGTANNGLQDGGEAGIPGVTVQLWSDPNGDGNPQDGLLQQSDVTDALGRYLFITVRDGNFVVVIDTVSLPGSTFTQTGDPDVIGACSGNNCNHRGSVSLNNNNGNPLDDDDLTLDFGYRIPNTLMGSVWEDNDGDGIWDVLSGENGLSSVTVWLDDCGANGICGDGDDGATRATSTMPDGSYVFSDLLGGNYRVRVNTATLPSGATWANTADPEGDLNNQTNVLAITGGNLYRPYDFGYHRSGTYSIGDMLYKDWNGDGTQGLGEEGIPNVTIRLYQDDNGNGIIDPLTDALIISTSTASNGSYGFSGLAAQQYIVMVDVLDADFPASVSQTQDTDETGVCTVCDNKAKAITGPSIDTIDFGYQPFGFGSIGDTVWLDSDQDGIQDPAEVGIQLITVSLYEDSNSDGVLDSSDAWLSTVETDTSGNYLFSGLYAWNYLVIVDTNDPDLPQDGYSQNYVLSNGSGTKKVALASGEVNLDADFGFTAGGTIGDYIWQDNNADGSQDLSEPGISNVSISLYVDKNQDGGYDVGDSLWGSQSSDLNGFYTFTSLPAGYYVVVVSQPTGYMPSGDPDEGPPCSVCDNESSLYLSAGQIDRSRDFGYIPSGILGNFVWLDLNGDGVQDAGESGISFVEVVLTTQTGSVYTTTTDSDGYYAFGNIPAGTHNVQITTNTLPAGVSPTYDYDGGNDQQASVALGAGGINLDIDFGYQYAGAYALSGTVFHDDNSNGLDDEAHLSGAGYYSNVTVYLWNNSNQFLGSTTTDTLGDYGFTNLPPGTYTVSMNPNAPDIIGMSPTTATHLGATIVNSSVIDLDFGFISSVDMGDLPETYYTSLNNNGPRHRIGSIYLGLVAPDLDADGQPDNNAKGDDNDGQNDDDGVSRVMTDLWTPGASVRLQVVVTGGNGYLVSWFDWDSSGSFEADERIIFGSLSTGSHTLSLTIPNDGSYQTQDPVNARFRIYAANPLISTPSGYSNNGEVEDYRWVFGPTAVDVANFGAMSGGNAFNWQGIAAIILIACVFSMSILKRIQRKK